MTFLLLLSTVHWQDFLEVAGDHSEVSEVVGGVDQGDVAIGDEGRTPFFFLGVQLVGGSTCSYTHVDRYQILCSMPMDCIQMEGVEET